MTRTEFLLNYIASEAAEVSQAATKAIQFGLGDTNPKTSLDGAAQLEYEINDLLACVALLNKHCVKHLGFPEEPIKENVDLITKKMQKVEKYYRLRNQQGGIEHV